MILIDHQVDIFDAVSPAVEKEGPEELFCRRELHPELLCPFPIICDCVKHRMAQLMDEKELS